MIQINLFTKYTQTHRLRERNYSYQGVGTVREFGIDINTLLYLKMDNQQGAIVYHWELSSMLCGSLHGMGIWGRMDTCVCNAESLYCQYETTPTLLISYTSIKNKKVKK